MKTEQLHKEIYEAPSVEIIDIEVEQNIMGGSPGYYDIGKDKNLNIGFGDDSGDGFDL